MKTRLANATLLMLLMFSAAIPVHVHAQPGSDGQYAVIVNPANSTESVSSRQLRRFLVGEEKFWGSHVPVFLVLRDGTSAEGDFAMTQIAAMSPGDFRQFWNAKVFRGEVTAEPTIVPSNGLASGLVAARSGGIGIILASNVPKDGSVKVLKVDGKLPGEAGYPLHR